MQVTVELDDEVIDDMFTKNLRVMYGCTIELMTEIFDALIVDMNALIDDMDDVGDDREAQESLVRQAYTDIERETETLHALSLVFRFFSLDDIEDDDNIQALGEQLEDAIQNAMVYSAFVVNHR